MKDNNSLIGGHLLDEHIPTLARYYRKIVQAYAEQGITIHAVTPQNEPLYAAPYPSMLVTPQQEAQLVDAMRAEFDAAGLTTQVWAFDHNFAEAADFAASMLGTSDSGYTGTYRNTKAIAFHDYDGDPSAMSLLKTEYPDLDMAMTERMVWGTAGAGAAARHGDPDLLHRGDPLRRCGPHHRGGTGHPCHPVPAFQGEGGADRLLPPGSRPRYPGPGGSRPSRRVVRGRQGPGREPVHR